MKKIVLIFLMNSGVLFARGQERIDSISNLTIPYIQANLKSVIPVLKKNVEDAQRAGNTEAEAKTCGLLALALYFHGDYDENMVYATRSIRLFEKNGDWENVAKEYSELGYRLKATNMKDAEVYLQKAMRIAEQGNYNKPLLSIYNQYGEVKMLKKQDDSAMYYFFKGLEVKRRVNDSVGIPYSLNNIGEAYVRQGKFGLARTYFDEAMKYRIALKDHYGIADNYAYNGDMYFAMKNLPLAVENYEKSIALAEQYEITNLLRHNYDRIAQVYEVREDFMNALKYYKKYQALKDSLINKEVYDKMAELQMKFDTEAKEKQILEQQAVERTRNNTIRILAILVVSLALIIFLVYRSLKLQGQKRSKEYELQAAIEKIENQNRLHEQRLSISRDLHDNIGAQLTFIISSVETLKSGFRIEDESINHKLSSIRDFAKDTITELRDTIWAMNSNEIGFEEMSSRMMNFVKKAQKSHEHTNIRFQIDAELRELKFASSTGMNIYRIIQEAVNNALKHSEAHDISIRMKNAGTTIEIAVTDNGKGFDKHEVVWGSGLRNIKKRVAEIGNNFRISSEKRTGTEVYFELEKRMALPE